MHVNPPGSKAGARLALALAYVLALLVAVGVGYLLRGKQPILISGSADIAATIVVFIFSL